jgi:hypothetical protein
MQAYFLIPTLKEQGHKFSYFQRRNISEVALLTDEGTLYVNRAGHLYHRKMLKMVKSGDIAKADNEHFLTPAYGWKSVKLEQVKKVRTRTANSGPIGTLSGDDTIKLYRALHLDTMAAVELHPAWLIDTHLMKEIGSFLTAPGIRSDLECVEDIILPRRKEYGYWAQSRDSYPQGKPVFPANRADLCLLPNYLLTWDEKASKWVKGD